MNEKEKKREIKNKKTYSNENRTQDHPAEWGAIR